MSKHLLTLRARSLRENQTKAETIIWEHLRKYKLAGYKFRRQHVIHNYIADFYCPQVKLAIEIDGSIHDLVDIMEYDKIRQEAIESIGIRVLRIKNEDVYENIDLVLEQISRALEEQKLQLIK